MPRKTEPRLPPHLLEEVDRILAMTCEIDTSDIPEVADWSKAERGKFYRPIKRQVTLRLDSDILEHFARGGRGYQTRINAALRKVVSAGGK